MANSDGLSFGIVCLPDPALVNTLEALPIDSLWIGGHVASINPSPEAMMQLAQMVALTTRVQVGAAVLLLPLYPPAIVAKQIADLDRASGGRVVLGVGVGGEYPQEFRACQIPITERGARTDEAIALLRLLWSGEPETHVGRFYSMEDVRIHPSPAQPGGPSIIVAGRKEAAMRRAAILGDGWMPYLFSVRRYAESVETIHRLADEAGRDLTGFQWFGHLFANVHEDGDTARNETAEFLGGNYRQDFRQMLGRVALAGTADDVVAGLNDFVRAGARHFVFIPASRTRVEDVALRIINDVIPRVTPALP